MVSPCKIDATDDRLIRWDSVRTVRAVDKLVSERRDGRGCFAKYCALASKTDRQALKSCNGTEETESDSKS